MIEGLQLVAHGSSELKAYSLERLSGAIGLLLDRAVEKGKISADITPGDLPAHTNRHLLFAGKRGLSADGITLSRCIGRGAA
jgi:hypothetical protein